jgi:hypothetical protein
MGCSSGGGRLVRCLENDPHEWHQVPPAVQELLIGRARRLAGWPTEHEPVHVLVCRSCGRASLRREEDYDVEVAERRPLLRPRAGEPE